MKHLGKFPSIVGAALATGVAALALIAATPAQAANSWGFGMAYGPSVMASCNSYNLVPVRVDIPAYAGVGYITGLLTNPRSGFSRRPAFGTDVVSSTGSPQLRYIVFSPPSGTVDGDILHVKLSVSAHPGGSAVGSFEFSYNCTTGEVIFPPSVDAINVTYGDQNVALANGTDANGNPDVEIWCKTPQGDMSFMNLAITQEMLASVPETPSVNKLILENNTCLLHVAIYKLTSGEIQVTLGPDVEGQINEVVFTGLPPTNIHFKKYNVNQQ